MRFEQIIAAVTRTLVIRTVREMEAVRLFVGNVSFHLGYQRMHFWISALMQPMHAGSHRWPSSLADLAGGIDAGATDCKRGGLRYQPALVLANRPANGRVRFAKV